MKALYFSNKKSSTLLKKTVGVVSSTFSSVAPQLFGKACYKIFMNPRGKRSYQFSSLSPEELFINGHHGKIKTYFFKGGEKHILLIHGWADNSKSFETLIKELINTGFSVWCFDHAGHGKSEGNIGNIFAILDGIKNVSAHIEKQGVNFYGLISHSMGGAAVINLEEKFLMNKKVVFIAAPVMLFEALFETFNRIGISDKVTVRMLEFVSKEYGGDWKKLKPMDHKSKVHQDFFIIHDKLDKQCKYDNMVKLIEGTPAILRSSKGLGHRRILKDAETLRSVVEFLQ